MEVWSAWRKPGAWRLVWAGIDPELSEASKLEKKRKKDKKQGKN